MVTKLKIDERRKFERLTIPNTTGVEVLTKDGGMIGPVVVIGRGGMMVETSLPFVKEEMRYLIIRDASEGIHREVRATVRDVSSRGIGFQFEDLGPDAAVEVGVIIGKYYVAPVGKK